MSKGFLPHTWILSPRVHINNEINLTGIKYFQKNYKFLIEATKDVTRYIIGNASWTLGHDDERSFLDFGHEFDYL